MSEHIGPYRIEKLLARGGMGEVFRAWDEKLERHVAIKLIRAHRVDSYTLRWFLREARTAARLNHPAIVRIHHIEEVEGGDECIVMELVEGRTLARIIDAGPLEPDACLAIACQIAEGLVEAHGKGIVHRDLKTENVMVTPEGRVKILDFGLAKPLDPGDRDISSHHKSPLGTPRAMSPEQANGLDLDHRSDLFSFGTLLYEVAAGQPPFRGRTPLVTLHHVCEHRPPPAREVHPAVPLELSELIDHLLEKRPEDRPSSTLEVLERLRGMREGRPDPADVFFRPPVLHDERRQVTLLACDVVPGNGAPKSRAMVSVPGFVDGVDRVVQRHLGSLVHASWDGVVACFGYPQAHEDDAVRGARAAREILERFGNALARHDPPLAIRSALHAGMLKIPRPAEGETRHVQWRKTLPRLLGELRETVVGIRDRTDLGGVGLSAALRPLIEREFVCEGLPSGNRVDNGVDNGTDIEAAGTGIAGINGDRLFRIIDRVERRGDRPRGELARLVARREELEWLEERWRLAREGKGQAVLLSAEAGFGKTHLVRALWERLDLESEDFWICRASAHFQNSALRPMVALLWQLLGTSRDDDSACHWARLEEIVRGHSLPLAWVPLFGSLLGLPASREIPRRRERRQREELLTALVELVLALAAERPRVWVIEDLHWADPSSLELMEWMIEQVAVAPLLLILTARPRFVPPFEERAHLTPMRLGPLTRDQVEAVIRQSAGKRLPSELVAKIAERADGVPLFAAELTRWVIDSPLVIERRDRYELCQPPGELRVPATLRDALMARLDLLGPSRQVAQLVAVFGREVSHELLVSVSPFDQDVLSRELDRLVDAEWLHRRGVSRVSYVFRHSLLQQAAYESLAPEERRAYHAAIARALEAEFSDTVRLHPELLAHHYSQAGDTSQSVVFWLQAGQRSWSRREAQHHLRRGLQLLEDLPENAARHRLECHYLLALGACLATRHGFATPELGRIYERLKTLQETLGDADDFKVAWGRFGFHLTAGDWARADKLGRHLEELADASQDPVERALALAGRGLWHFHRGEPAVAAELLERGRSIDCDGALVARAYIHHPTILCQLWAARAVFFLGRPGRALELAEAAVVRARRRQEPYDLAAALGGKALIHGWRREPSQSRQAAAEQLELARRHGFEFLIASARLCHGAAQVEEGASAAGLAELQRGLEAWTASGTQAGLTLFMGEVARAYLSAREIGLGLAILGQALEIADRGGESFYLAELLRLRGELLERKGDARQAESSFARAHEVARRQGAVAFELRAAVSWGRRLLARGAGERARQLVGEARERFTDGFETADLREAESLLGE